jgi:hypothetical protein
VGDILKLSMDEQEKLADQYDKKKLEFEKSLMGALYLFFNKMSKDINKAFSDGGAIIDTSDYYEEFKAILKKSYDESTEYFSEHFDRELKRQIARTTNSELAQRSSLILLILIDQKQNIKRSLNEYIAIQTDKQTKIILKTTQEIIDKTISEVTDELDEALPVGENPTNQEIGKESSIRIENENDNRVGTISETEVSMGSGQGEQTEANILGGMLASEDLGQLIIQKTWLSQLDGVVREAHLIAHGQKQPTSRPFNVGGEQLQYPTDTSLGASMGNIINCRCFSINT